MKIGDLVIYRSAMDTMPFRGIVVDLLPGIHIRYGFDSEYIFIDSELIRIHWLCEPDLGPEMAVQKLIRLNQEINQHVIIKEWMKLTSEYRWYFAECFDLDDD